MNCPGCPNYKEQLPEFDTIIMNGIKLPILLNNPDNTPCEKHALEVWAKRFAESSIKFFQT